MCELIFFNHIGTLISRIIGSILLDELRYSPFFVAFVYGVASAVFSVGCTIQILRGHVNVVCCVVVCICICVCL